MRNPYPEKIFPAMSEEELKKTHEVLKNAGISLDRLSGSWGREVWNMARQATLKEVGEWLIRKHGLILPSSPKELYEMEKMFIGSHTCCNVSFLGIKRFLKGEMPVEVEE